MSSSELHLFILWENALYKKQEMLEEINKTFKIVKIYNVKWSNEYFIQNLSRFYGTNLPDCEAKAFHCGKGPFCLIIVKDENPKYEDRNTSKGIKRLNINMFDTKEKFRRLTGGGHKVHATNDEIETNHDITLLLGKSLRDFLKENNKDWNGKEENLNKDLMGFNGWKNVQEMFYVLNNCIKYAVLRNYEGLPEEIYINEHNDIDLICESKENCAYILNAEKVFLEDYRVNYRAKVKAKYANFDLRYIGDNYYFEKLEKDILEKREYNEKGFYVLNKEDYYYTLLYHAIIHKKVFKPDYKTRLISMNNELINENTTIDEMLEVLKRWIKQNKYLITLPKDKSVDFNFKNANKFRHLLEMKNTNKNLKEFNVNIIKWYDFKEGSNIMIIGENEDIEKHLKTITSKLVVIRRFDEIQTDLKGFDYILIYGVEKYDNIIAKINSQLAENGKLIIIGNNVFGMNTWSKYNFNDYLGINRLQKHNHENITLKSVKNELEHNSMSEINIFYVFPNYTETDLILNEKLKIQKSQIEKYCSDVEVDEIKLFDEKEALKTIISNDLKMLEFFTNSFFIEASKKQIENDIRYVSFNNCRKEQYRLITLIRDNIVQKIPANEAAKKHVKNMKQTIQHVKSYGINILDYEENGSIYSKLIKSEKTLDEILYENYSNMDYIVELLNKIKEILIENSVEYSDCKKDITIEDKKNLEKLHFMKKAFWDMVPKNCFLLDSKFVFFDQEWEKEYLPVEFIIYRSIINSYDLVRKINVDELLKRLDILQYKEVFEKLDRELREEIIDENIYKEIYGKNIKSIDNIINDYKINQIRLAQVKEDNSKKQEYIEQLERENLKKEEYIKILEEKSKRGFFWKR